ncbi:MAG: ATPase, T2SS/T4P/T4SS family [Candidatus Nanopelagicales bacterium]
MTKRALGDVLLSQGRVTQAQIDDAIERQRNAPERLRLGRILVQEGIIDEIALAEALAEAHDMPAIDLAAAEVPLDVARLLPRDAALRYITVPVKADDHRVLVAVADPVDVVALDDLRARLPGRRVHVAVAPAFQIEELLDRAWGEQRNREALSHLVEREAPEPELDKGAEDEGASAIVNQLLTTAAHRRASDLHVEPQADSVRVRLRVDGIMRDLMHLPRESLSSVVARIKIISGLDVFTRRLPQDGRTKLRVGGQRRDIRVSTLPTIHGEKVVLRLLPSYSELPQLGALGMTPDQMTLLRNALHSTQGVILVTGPTGAGKSHTLYAALADTVDDQRNVITVEDPVEIEIAGITQVQVSESGVTFDSGLRAALRQDPDVLMVGEIRDTATGSIATRAALTGHLVLSTLHTNDAPSAVTRLVDLGVPRYLVGTALSLVIAQRLLRRTCPSCAAPHQPGADVIARLGLPPGTALVAGTGCPACDQTGFRGRVGCFELMVVDDSLRNAITDGASEAELRTLATTAGWLPLQVHARELALAGVTSPEEVLRATSSDYEPVAEDAEWTMDHMI